MRLIAGNARVMWPLLDARDVREASLLFVTSGGRRLRLASNCAYELWLDGAFAGAGGLRCASGTVEIDTWDATHAATVWVRLQYLNSETVSLWFRCLFPDPFMADLDPTAKWVCHRDDSVTFAAQMDRQLAFQNVVRAPVTPGAPLLLASVERPDWAAVEPAIAPLRHVPVAIEWTDTPRRGGLRSPFEPHRLADVFAGTRQAGLKNLFHRTGRLPLIGLHRVEVRNPLAAGVALLYGEVEDLNQITAHHERTKVHLADAVAPGVIGGAPVGQRGCRYIHVLGGVPVGAVEVTAWRQEYPLEWARLSPPDDLTADILQACRNNLTACIDGGAVDTCWRERAQWTGDLRMSAIALEKLTTNGLPVVERALAQIATSYDPAAAMVQGAWPVRRPDYRGLAMPTYHLAFCLTALRHGRDPRLLALVRESLLKWQAMYRRDDGLVTDVPGWHFVDWDTCDPLAADTGHRGMRQRPCPTSHAVVNAWHFEACVRAGLDPGIDPDRLHNAFFDPATHGYRLYPGSGPSVHATAAMLGSVPTDPRPLERSLAFITDTADLDERVTLYYGYFVAGALARHDPARAIDYIRRRYGPVARTYGTLYEKTHDRASLAHGWSVGIVDFLVS